MGFLHRKETGMAGRNSAWRSRWFVLRGQQLLMYADKAQDKPKDTISLLAASGIEEMPYDVRYGVEKNNSRGVWEVVRSVMVYGVPRRSAPFVVEPFLLLFLSA